MPDFIESFIGIAVTGLITSVSTIISIAILIGIIFELIEFQMWHLIFPSIIVLGIAAIIYLQRCFVKDIFENPQHTEGEE